MISIKDICRVVLATLLYGNCVVTFGYKNTYLIDQCKSDSCQQYKDIKFYLISYPPLLINKVHST